MRHALLAGAAILGLSACLPGGAETATDPLPAGSSFAVLAIEGRAAPEGTTFELSPEDEISGRAPCNRYMAKLTREGDGKISISPGASTRMACLDQDRAEAENRMLAALTEITTVAEGLEAGQVALNDAAGTTRLLLGPQAVE